MRAKFSELLVRIAFFLVARGLFRIRVMGRENIPCRGPALLVVNHVTFLDGFIIGFCVQRIVRFLVLEPYYRSKLLNWGLRMAHAIPVETHPLDLIGSIRRARRELEQGNVVCIFAEGSITRTGNLLPFKRGLEKILNGLDVPIVPVHLEGLWQSIFSFERGRFFWKVPRHLRHPVTVSFGRAMPALSMAEEVRQAVQQLGAEAVTLPTRLDDTLCLRFFRCARKNWRRLALADSEGRELTYGQALTESLVIAAWVRRHRKEDKMIAVLLPPSAAGALANIGVTASGRVPVNLDFTAGADAMASAMEQCRISTLLTSKIFAAQVKAKGAQVVFLEDIVKRNRKSRTAAWLAARMLPARLLSKRYSAGQCTADSLATVIFSSRRSGPRKGVLLSHYNIVSNIDAMAQVFWVGKQDRILGALPLFNVLGLTATLWFPLITGCSVVYHVHSADVGVAGSLISRYKCTFLLSSAAFCSSYAHQCTVRESASLRYAVVGEGKLRDRLARVFFEKAGLKLLEGYGCPEMAPVIAVNTPDFKMPGETQIGSKPGTVGHPLPGLAVRIVDPKSMQSLPMNRAGMVLVKGPNRMIGYLGQPERTSTVMLDGWYVTGDLGIVDNDGFLRITGRHVSAKIPSRLGFIPQPSAPDSTPPISPIRS